MKTQATPTKLRLGMTTTECRHTGSAGRTCRYCSGSMAAQLAVCHFETFRTTDFTACGIRHRPKIAWRVCGWSHLNCVERSPGRDTMGRVVYHDPAKHGGIPDRS
jgi:hypothetical protein